jgi:iron complex outermembrane recepter protein
MAFRDDPDSKRAGLLRRTAQVILALAITAWAGASPYKGPPLFDFRIERDALARELQEFMLMTGTSLLYEDKHVQMNGQGVRGRFTAEEALTRMLRETGLTCIHAQGGAAIVVRPSTHSDHPLRGRCLNSYRRPAGLQQGPRPSADTMSEVHIFGTNVGTHIHDVGQIGSPLVVWDETSIRRSGARNLSDLLSKMTQNFGGGPNQATHYGQAETFTNSGLGTSANLRGLGARATLVLLNGHPIAPSGSAASFVDLLNIPLSAVERVEVLLDGASAIYGSDAVGGVINIHTLEEYTLPETFAAIGSVTSGRQEEHRLSQKAGAGWDGGNLLVVGEVMHRGALAADERWQNNSELSSLTPALYASPGNLAVAGQILPIPPRQGGRPLDFATLLPGTPNGQNVYAGSDIVPAQSRWSLFSSLRQELGSMGTVFGDILWTQRQAVERQGGQEVVLDVTNSPFLLHSPPTTVLEYYNLLNDIGPQITAVNVRTVNASVGMEVNFPHSWRLVLSGSSSLEDESQTISGQANLAALQAAVSNPDPALAFDPFGAGSLTSASTLASVQQHQWYGSRSQLRDFAATVDGPFLLLPAGSLREAFGIEYRDQRFNTGFSQTDARSDLRRQLRAAFVEVAVPLLNATDYPAPWRALTLSLAGRIEDYSDLGETATPRLAVTWDPTPHLSARATWAESIRAPNLGDLAEQNNLSYVRFAGSAPALIWTGGNANLSVERALTRAFGLSFKSDETSRFSADIGYFDLHFRDRIQPAELVPDILSNPAYASLVTLNPSLGVQAAVCNQSHFIGAGTCAQLPIEALVDLRVRNSGTLWTDGFDVSLGTHFETPIGDWGVSFASTYILHYEQADTPTAPLVSLLNTLSNPLALQAIATTTWKIGNAETSLDIRYSNPYRNLETQPATHIASWTRADLRFIYTFNTGAFGSHPTEIAVNGANLFNRYSPFAINNVANVGYDQENGDLTGRTLALSIDVKW